MEQENRISLVPQSGLFFVVPCKYQRTPHYRIGHKVRHKPISSADDFYQ